MKTTTQVPTYTAPVILSPTKAPTPKPTPKPTSTLFPKVTTTATPSNIPSVTPTATPLLSVSSQNSEEGNPVALAALLIGAGGTYLYMKSKKSK
jgi:hypothetical protein